MTEILKLATANGIWAALFVFLFFYQLKDGKQREQKYTETISALSKSLSQSTDIKEEIEDIKDSLDEIKTYSQNRYSKKSAAKKENAT